MTDMQLVNLVRRRASKCSDNENASSLPKIVVVQQYHKKLYFALKFENSKLYSFLTFSQDNQSVVFRLPELPERLMDWKHDIIKRCESSKEQCVEFDISTFPKEIVHMFCCSIISALNTPGMSVMYISESRQSIFEPDETYEEIQIEADMQVFDGEFQC